MAELHGKGPAALGNRTESSRITEHFGKWHTRRYDLHRPPAGELFDLSLSRIEIPDNFTHKFLGYQYLGFHGGFEKQGFRLHEGISKGH